MSAPENLPLNSILAETGVPRLYGVANNPEILIREEGNVHSTEELSKAAALFAELRDGYGIKVPNYSPFLAANLKSGRNDAFVVVQKIHGTSLEQAIDARIPEALHATAELHNSLASYISDKATGDEEMLTDIFGNHQYMWGRVAGEAQDSAYLADVGVMVSHFNQFTGILPKWKTDAILSYALFMYADTITFSEKTDQPTPALAKIYDIIDRLPASDRAIDRVVTRINAARSVGKTASANVVDLLFE